MTSYRKPASRFLRGGLALFLALGTAAIASARDDDSEAAELLVAAIDGPAPPTAPDVISRGEDGKVTVRATELRQPLQIDGRLEENVYRTTPAMSDFIQQEPLEGTPATEKTEVWVFFDDKQRLRLRAQLGLAAREDPGQRDAAGQPEHLQQR